MSTPLVSICTPTYHRPVLLERAIRSVIAQTYQNFEIVITDNSENNESEELVKRINDPRIRYYRNPQNLGILPNIKKVETLAEGKYITVLMDDDLLKPQALELMVAAFEKHPNVAVVMAPMALIDKDDNRSYPYFYVFRKMYYRYRFQVGDGLVTRKTLLKEYLTHDYPCCVPSGIMYRTEAVRAVGGFDVGADFAIDLDLDMRLAARHDFYYIDQVLSSFRYTPVSLTSAMHSKGFNTRAFYYISRKTLADETAMSLFTPAERPKLIRDSIFFCSCRVLLNGLAALKTRNLKMIRETIKVIFEEDPYWWNKVRLPWFVLREVAISFIPPSKPLPKE